MKKRRQLSLMDGLSLKEKIDDAGGKATKFITTISGTSGISVHDANDTSNYVNIASGVIDMVTGGVSRLKAYVENNVAKFRIGDESAGNIMLDSNSATVRNGITDLASFAANIVQLGKNSLSSVIDMCASALRITSAVENDGQGYDPDTYEPYDIYKQKATITSRVTSPLENVRTCEIELKAAPLLNEDVSDGSKAYLQSGHDGFAEAGLITDQRVLEVNNASSSVYVQAYPNDYGGNGEASLESAITIEDETIIDYDVYDFRMAQGYFKIETIFDNADPEYIWLDAEAKIKGTKFTIEYDDIGAPHSPHYLYTEFAYTPGYEDIHTIHTAGYITNSKTDMYLMIPLSKPLLGVPKLSSVTAITRQNNAYTHGSSASSAVSWSVIAVDPTIGGLNVQLRRSTVTNAVNNAPVGIQLSFTLKIENP